MLFTLICQFFITKLRRRFAPKDSLPGPVPNILAPVTAQEHREALIQDLNGQPIEHPSISAVPEGPQLILTIGMIMELIQPFIPKMGPVHSKLRHLLESSAQSFASHARAKVERLLAMEDPPG